MTLDVIVLDRRPIADSPLFSVWFGSRRGGEELSLAGFIIRLACSGVLSLINVPDSEWSSYITLMDGLNPLFEISLSLESLPTLTEILTDLRFCNPAVDYLGLCFD